MYESYKNVDRRNQDRFTIPGAKVLYKAKDKSIVVSPLVDISKSSLRFELIKDIAESPHIDFELFISPMEKISLKGKVVWDSLIDFDQKKYVAIQFLPFGSWNVYNSPESFARIVMLFNKYCKILQE